MALRGVSPRLLSRGPVLRWLRGWGSAAALTGECRVRAAWGGWNWRLQEFSGVISRPVFSEKGGKTQSRPDKRKDPSSRVRLRPLSCCLSARWALSESEGCPGREAGPWLGPEALSQQ